MVTGFSVHEDEAEARRRGEDGFRFFGYALSHHYVFGEHKPGVTDIWANFEQAKAAIPSAGPSRGIGTPEQLREHLRGFEAAGVDQVAFIQQGGRNRHEHICEALELFARDVMPEFKARETARRQARLDELAPYIEQAMARKQKMKALAPDEVPSFLALNRQIAEQGKADQLTEAQRKNQAQWRKITEGKV
jgi:hypothetical protein